MQGEKLSYNFLKVQSGKQNVFRANNMSRVYKFFLLINFLFPQSNRKCRYNHTYNIMLES